MSEERSPYLLQSVDKSCMLDDKPPIHEVVQVSRQELEQERRHLLGRLQQLHRLLGYPPLLTGKEERRQTFAK